MLNGGAEVSPAECFKPDLYTLIFGNEATGLPAEYAEVGTVIKIPQSEEVDSLNLIDRTGKEGGGREFYQQMPVSGDMTINFEFPDLITSKQVYIYADIAAYSTYSKYRNSRFL
jgi:hypothetical protein